MDAEIQGVNLLETRVNYFLGSDAARWVSGAPTYGEVVYRNLYPRIDLCVSGDGESIKLEYRLRPGGKVSDIRWSCPDAEAVALDTRGRLEVRGKHGVLREEPPLCRQTVAGKTVDIGASFIIGAGGTVRFEVEDHDRHLELVIDPEVRYLTFLGGGSADFA